MDQCSSMGLEHGALRVESQNLHELKANCEGTLSWMPGVALIKSVEMSTLAIIVPGDQNIRWFCVRQSATGPLERRVY
jgi:hypothetical protein